MSDRELIAKWRGGEEAALIELFDRYSPLIRKMAYLNTPYYLREDALSVVRLAFMEAVAAYDEGRGVPFAAYARSRTWAAARSYRRQEARRLGQEVPLDKEAEALTIEEHSELAAALGELDPAEVRFLKLTEEHSQQELALRLGISQQAVSKRRRRILDKLREKLTAEN